MQFLPLETRGQRGVKCCVDASEALIPRIPLLRCQALAARNDEVALFRFAPGFLRIKGIHGIHGIDGGIDAHGQLHLQSVPPLHFPGQGDDLSILHHAVWRIETGQPLTIKAVAAVAPHANAVQRPLVNLHIDRRLRLPVLYAPVHGEHFAIGPYAADLQADRPGLRLRIHRRHQRLQHLPSLRLLMDAQQEVQHAVFRSGQRRPRQEDQHGGQR